MKNIDPILTAAAKPRCLAAIVTRFLKYRIQTRTIVIAKTTRHLTHSSEGVPAANSPREDLTKINLNRADIYYPVASRIEGHFRMNPNRRVWRNIHRFEVPHLLFCPSNKHNGSVGIGTGELPKH